MIRPLAKEIKSVHVGGDPRKEVLVFADGGNYTDSFGYEWSNYPATYVDSALGENLSLSRLELNLGFPVSFLKDMNVLELGCGAGRFTEHLVKHARQVVAVDFSDAIFHNAALGAPNLLALRADLMNVPQLSEPIDLIFCRGVVQHTENPRATLFRFFEYVPENAFVIFDVYKKNKSDWRSFKYFWRPVFQRLFSVEKFDAFLKGHDRFLYALHHGWLRVVSAIPLVKRLFALTPFYLSTNWNTLYPNLPKEKRLDLFRNEMIDMLYSHFDQPMTPEEVVSTLAEIGQTPYSYDIWRNHFRYRKKKDRTPLKVKMTKNGVVKDTL